MNNTQNYEKKRKRKIFLSILMILFVGIILTASTYAWFTANQTVTVQTIDVNVAAQNGLQVSTDGTSWKTVITNEDLLATLGSSTLYPGNTNMLPFRGDGTTPSASIVPVSTTADTAVSGKLNYYIGSVDSDTSGNELLTATKMTEAKGQEGSLVAFDLFFQVTQESQVYLTNNSRVSVWSDGDNTSTTAEETDKGLQNSARIAWLREGNSPIGTALSTIQAQSASGTTSSGKGNTTGNVIVWEPNSNTHSASGITHAGIYTSTTVTSNSPNVLSYNGIKSEISSGVPLNSTNSSYFGSVTGLFSTTNTGVGNGQTWFKLAAGVTKVRFYLWIEGQDVDCENTASGQSLSYNMQFSLLEDV